MVNIFEIFNRLTLFRDKSLRGFTSSLTFLKEMIKDCYEY